MLNGAEEKEMQKVARVKYQKENTEDFGMKRNLLNKVHRAYQNTFLAR